MRAKHAPPPSDHGPDEPPSPPRPAPLADQARPGRAGPGRAGPGRVGPGKVDEGVEAEGGGGARALGEGLRRHVQEDLRDD